jgi:hypothetical protein
MPPVWGGINTTLLPPHWQVALMISVPLPLQQALQQQQQLPTTPEFLGFRSLMSRAVEAGTITNQQQSKVDEIEEAEDHLLMLTGQTKGFLKARDLTLLT